MPIGSAAHLVSPVPPTRPPIWRRAALAICVGLAAALLSWHTQRSMLAADSAPDSLFLWRGARILIAGGDPYAAATWAVAPVGEVDAAAWKLTIEPLYYPLPALLVWVPFAFGSFLAGSIAFCGVGAALFAFAVSRLGLYRVWLCGGVPFIVAIRFGQWSTWLVAASLLPLLGFLLLAKPNLGLPLFLARPSRAPLFGCLALLLASVAVAPEWPRGWWRNITGEFGASAPHRAPVALYFGLGTLVALLALLRWRRSEARLLALMACVPQLPFWADQLVLAPIAQTKREVIWTVLAGHLAFLSWYQFAPKVELYVPVMQPYALAATYLPALMIVLRRDNAGAVPRLFVPLVSSLPRWLRGAPVASE